MDFVFKKIWKRTMILSFYIVLPSVVNQENQNHRGSYPIHIWDSLLSRWILIAIKDKYKFFNLSRFIKLADRGTSKVVSTFYYVETIVYLCRVKFIHKPRGQLMGEGVSQMTILILKPYLIKVAMKREGVKNTQNFDHVVLWMTP